MRAALRAILFGSAPVWTPLALGSSLVAWYDAADASTITQSSGAVSQWKDKSGNANHLLQSTAGNKPTYSATGFQSNTPGITFDGVNDFLSAANINIGTTAFSAFITAQFSTTAGTSLNLLGYQANGDGGPWDANSVVLFETDGAGAFLDSYKAGTKSKTATHSGSNIMVSGAYYKMGTVFDGANNNLWIDNAYTPTAVAATGALVTPGTLLLGARADGSAPYGAAVGEIIIMNRAATAAERAQIDSFFLRRWTRVVATEGDSLTALGTTVSLLRPPQLFIPNSNPPAYLADIATPGIDFWVNATSIWDNVPWTDSRLPTNKRGRQYILFFAFANNIYGGLHSAATTPQGNADGYATYCLARKVAGWDKIVVGTALSRTDAQANDTFRNAFNTIIRAPGWAAVSGVDAICDYAADAIMGVDAAPTVNSGYFTDAVHPNVAGFARLEVIFRACINGL